MGRVIYCDSDGVIEDAKQWVKDNNYTADDIKIYRRGKCVVVIER